MEGEEIKGSHRGWWSYYLPRAALWGVPILCCGSFMCPRGDQKGAARVTMTISNMKQLGTSLLIYSTDYDGQLPAAERWADAVMPYAKNKDMLEDVTLNKEVRHGFAFYEPLQRVDPERVESAERVPMLFQTDAREFGAHGWRDLLPLKPRGRDGKDIYCLANSSVKMEFRDWPEWRVRIGPKKATAPSELGEFGLPVALVKDGAEQGGGGSTQSRPPSGR